MGLHQNVMRESVSQLELREVVPVTPQMTCREAVDLMRRKRHGYVVVVDAQDRPIGMFTERVLVRLLLRGAAALEEPVSKHISPRAFIVRASEPIAKAIQMMRTHDWRFLCVVDDRGKAIGVTGQRGIMEYLAEHFPRQVKAQMIGSKLYMDQREGA